MDIQSLSQINPLYIVVALVIIALIIIVISIIRVNKNKNKINKISDLPFALEDLVKAIGGIENIIDVNATISKVTFKFRDNNKVELDKVKELGATGTVETSNGITFIFGSMSKTIETLVKEIL